jgi:polysaccharide export outer membrane protein
MLAACAVLLGCASAGLPDASTAALRPATVPPYQLSPGDKLAVKVFNEPDLTGEYQIDESGAIAYPLVGGIQAAGMTPDDFRAALVKRLQAGYVRNPRVTVDILNYQPINIIGEVRNAGQFPYRPGLSAKDIPAIAGGYTYRAKEDTIHVTRGAGKPIVVRLDEGHFAIMPGDTIKVPERFF